jgi:hypothetical protein
MDVTRGSFVTLDGLSANGKATVAPEPNVAEGSRVDRAFGLLHVDGTERLSEEVARATVDIVPSRVPHSILEGNSQ